MLKKIIKKIVGEKRIQKIKRKQRMQSMVSNEMAYENKTEIEAAWIRTVIMAHSIEKSMAICDLESLKNLNRYSRSLDDCDYLLHNGYEADSYVIVEIISVVSAALSFLESKQIIETEELLEIRIRLKALVDRNQIAFSENAGIIQLSDTEIEQGKNFDWSAFSSSRKSIRIFKNTFIDEETVRKIIDGAKSYPSACNRQPCRVYYGKTKEDVLEISKYVNDSRTVRDHIHNFLIVTVDRNKFSDGELYQNYINGGIYLGYLVLSIHSLGLGGCIFQYVQNNKKDIEFHRKFHIPMQENIIAFIAFGEVLQKNNIPCADRQKFSDTARAVEI